MCRRIYLQTNNAIVMQVQEINGAERTGHHRMLWGGAFLLRTEYSSTVQYGGDDAKWILERQQRLVMGRSRAQSLMSFPCN